MEHPGPQIPSFYAGRSIFITGATGFLGKVLVERLLSTCPDINRLYLLMRAKKDVLPEKRLLQLKQSQAFDEIRRTNPSQLEKLCIIPGDTTRPQLGMTMESLEQLQEVSVVFHSAATVKFDEPLRQAVQQNVRSVLYLLQICDQLQHIQVLAHVSTAYSNAELQSVEEKVYPPPVPVEGLLAFVDAVPDDLLAQITEKYIHPKPNTYTFTKAIAENVIRDHKPKGYSIAIFRPTIVISSLRHPYPGWIENLNGPSGIVVSVGKGLLHVFPCRPSARADLLPVDVAIDTLIAVAWETAVDRLSSVRVYNCSTCRHPTLWSQFDRRLRANLQRYPMDRALWYPSGYTANNWYVEKILEVLLHTVPLYVAEYAATLLGIKTRLSLISVDHKLRMMSNSLKFFSLREWHFTTDNVERLTQRLSAADAQLYTLDVCCIDWEEQYRNMVIGTRKYLLQEKDEDLPEARRHMMKMRYLHYTAIFVLFLICIRLLLQNQFVKESVYGIFGLLFSAFASVCLRITSVFV